jgi:hypothetical protein
MKSCYGRSMRGIIALVLCGACSFTEGRAAQQPDGSGSGSGSAAAFQPGKEIVAGAGRVTAGTITIDVEIGHGILPRKSTAGTITVNGNPVVRP